MSRLIVKNGRRCVVGGRLVTNAGGAPCVCGGEPPSESCLDQLLRCGCNDPAQAIYASSSIFDSLPEGHEVVSLGGNCWRRVARFSGQVPSVLRYDPAIHGEVDGSYPNCYTTPCELVTCDCLPPGVSIAGVECNPNGSGTVNTSICAAGGFHQYSRRSLQNLRSYNLQRDSSGEAFITESIIRREAVVDLRGVFQFDQFGQAIWQSVTGLVSYRHERINIQNSSDDVFVDNFAEFSGSDVPGSVVAAELFSGGSIFPPVSAPTTDGKPNYGTLGISTGDTASGCDTSGYPSGVLDLCNSDVVTSLDCEWQSPFGGFERTTRRASGYVGELGNFRYTDNDTFTKRETFPDGDVTNRDWTATNNWSSTFIWFPNDSGVIVEGDCTTGDNDPGTVPETRPADGFGPGNPGRDPVAGQNPQQSQIDHFGCSGCGG